MSMILSTTTDLNFLKAYFISSLLEKSIYILVIILVCKISYTHNPMPQTNVQICLCVVLHVLLCSIKFKDVANSLIIHIH